MITGRANYTDAGAECAKYGWSLLDYTYGRVDHLIDLVQQCYADSPQPFAVGYIRSFNGVASLCPAAQVVGYGVAPNARVNIAGNEAWCLQDAPQQVFCQEQCPFEVADSGVEVGQVSLTTVTSSVTATLYTPTTTKTVKESCTETVHLHRK